MVNLWLFLVVAAYVQCGTGSDSNTLPSSTKIALQHNYWSKNSHCDLAWLLLDCGNISETQQSYFLSYTHSFTWQQMWVCVCVCVCKCPTKSQAQRWGHSLIQIWQQHLCNSWAFSLWQNTEIEKIQSVPSICDSVTNFFINSYHYRAFSQNPLRSKENSNIKYKWEKKTDFMTDNKKN